MKAAVLAELNQPLGVADVTLGEIKYGQVLVRILVSGICGAQLQEIAGHKGNGRFLPHLMGHEGCGIVEQIGAGVTTVREGDKVVLHWRKGSGIESEFPKYILNDREITSGRVTTFSEQAIVSENRATRVPFDTDPELCALMGCGLSTALGTLERDARLKLGESLLVIGVGGLGCNLIKTGALMHATPIVAVDIKAGKRSLAELMGASVFASTWATLRHSLRAAGITGFDVIVDTSGDTDAIRKALTFLLPAGRFIMVGQPLPRKNVTVLNARHFFDGDSQGKMIIATQGGGFQPHLDIPRYIRLHENKQIDVSEIITHRMNLDQINEAIGLVRQGAAGRILITP